MLEETLADQMRAGENHQKQSLCGNFAVTGDGPQFSGFVSLAGRISLAATKDVAQGRRLHRHNIRWTPHMTRYDNVSGGASSCRAQD